ncbi:hypothetical protein P8452_76612 [Trifolium repens]|nr:hypothetical protein P8452_76612 [Trifolium repens]
MRTVTQLISLTTTFHHVFNNISQFVQKPRKNQTTRQLLKSILNDLSLVLAARILSVSTDETCVLDWSQMQPDQAEHKASSVDGSCITDCV